LRVCFNEDIGLRADIAVFGGVSPTRTLKYYGRFPYFLEMFLEIQMPKWTHIPNSLWKRFWNFFHNSSIFDFENMEA